MISDSKEKDTKDNKKDVSRMKQDKIEIKKTEPEYKTSHGSKKEIDTKENSHIVTNSEEEIDKTKQKLVEDDKFIKNDESELHKYEAENDKVQIEEIISNKTKLSGKEQTSSPLASQSELEEAFKELCDPLLPVRGHGLIRLTRMVQRRDKEAYERKETILKIFEENLDHPDSYMYLSSVNGLAAMADLFPDLVIPRLCEQFTNTGNEGKRRSPELRMKLGEIMVKASRSLGI